LIITGRLSRKRVLFTISTTDFGVSFEPSFSVEIKERHQCAIFLKIFQNVEIQKILDPFLEDYVQGLQFDRGAFISGSKIDNLYQSLNTRRVIMSALFDRRTGYKLQYAADSFYITRKFLHSS
jgi:hypothetical protein